MFPTDAESFAEAYPAPWVVVSRRPHEATGGICKLSLGVKSGYAVLSVYLCVHPVSGQQDCSLDGPHGFMALDSKCPDTVRSADLITKIGWLIAQVIINHEGYLDYSKIPTWAHAAVDSFLEPCAARIAKFRSYKS